MARQSQNMLDQIAEDLAYFIDDMATQLAEAMSAGGTAPFAAQITEEDKLRYYTSRFFSADGSPNLQGRVTEMQRLGPENFALVFKAVMKAHPDLAVPPPQGAAIPSPLSA
jgi:hypothetical protein